MGDRRIVMAKEGGGQHEGTNMQRAAVDAVAGVVAGGVSRSIVSPLDVIKIRFQVQFPTFSRFVVHEFPLVSKVSKRSNWCSHLSQAIFRSEVTFGASLSTL